MQLLEKSEPTALCFFDFYCQFRRLLMQWFTINMAHNFSLPLYKTRYMKGMTDDPNSPLHHTTKIKQEFEDLVTHLRSDVNKVNDPKAKALFETSAEVIDGLKKAFADYEEGKEEAWKK